MELNLKQSLVAFLKHLYSTKERLQIYKIPLQTAKLIFKNLDKNNKGYLSLEDLYDEMIEVNRFMKEEELFNIFKQFDVEKEEKVGLKAFLNAVSRKENILSQLKNKSPQQQFRQYLRVMMSNLGTIQFKKTQFNFQKDEIISFLSSINQYKMAFQNKIKVQEVNYLLSSSLVYTQLVYEGLLLIFKDRLEIQIEEFAQFFLPLKPSSNKQMIKIRTTPNQNQIEHKKVFKIQSNENIPLKSYEGLRTHKRQYSFNGFKNLNERVEMRRKNSEIKVHERGEVRIKRSYLSKNLTTTMDDKENRFTFLKRVMTKGNQRIKNIERQMEGFLLMKKTVQKNFFPKH